ncbi:MAG: hypothetical protein SFY81_15090 [Verrucomicrobiota bacterium]|nr:hypothetical protein [Verrucomicrobiota bacterium]
MKRLHQILTVSILFSSLQAAPLQPSRISENARWFLHLDVDALRKTAIGSEIIKKANMELARTLEGKGAKLDFSTDKLHSITAYGLTYAGGSEPEGVLLLDTTANVINDFKTVASTMAPNGLVPFDKVPNSVHETYLLADDLYVSKVSDSLYLVGKSNDRIKDAHQVLGGGSKSLATGNSFLTQLGTPGESFFFMAAGKAFKESPDKAPHAAILKNAEAARLVVTEHGDQTALTLSIAAESSEVLKQMQEAIQGIVALVTLTQSENKELVSLVQKLKISTQDKLITLNVQVPTTEILKKMNIQAGAGK